MDKLIVDSSGYVIRPAVIVIEGLNIERGPLSKVNAVVLHRTAVGTLQETWEAFARGCGTHFVIDKDGAIYQAATLKSFTWHVGKIRRRVQEGSDDGAERLQKKTLIEIHRAERERPYPSRYPINEDCVGIEVVANLFEGDWEDPSDSQVESVTMLVEYLKGFYGLTSKDVFAHDRISYKVAGEGQGLYQPERPKNDERG